MGFLDSLKDALSKNTTPSEVREFRDRANNALNEEAKKSGTSRESDGYRVTNVKEEKKK